MNEGVMRSIIKNAPLLLENPEDYNARANIMWASSMALASFQFVLGKKVPTGRCMRWDTNYQVFTI